MSLPIFRIALVAVLVVASTAMSGCNRKPDNGAMAATESDQIREAADAGKIWCALSGASNFTFDCSLDRMDSPGGTILVLGKAEGGFRRFRIATDGRGVIAADGAEPATVKLLDNNLIEVSVGQDRYRLPATVKPAA